MSKQPSLEAIRAYIEATVAPEVFEQQARQLQATYRSQAAAILKELELLEASPHLTREERTMSVERLGRLLLDIGWRLKTIDEQLAEYGSAKESIKGPNRAARRAKGLMSKRGLVVVTPPDTEELETPE